MDYLGLVEGEGIFPAAIVQSYRHIEPENLSLDFVWDGESDVHGQLAILKFYPCVGVLYACNLCSVWNENMGR